MTVGWAFGAAARGPPRGRRTHSRDCHQWPTTDTATTATATTHTATAATDTTDTAPAAIPRPAPQAAHAGARRAHAAPSCARRPAAGAVWVDLRGVSLQATQCRAYRCRLATAWQPL